MRQHNFSLPRSSRALVLAAAAALAVAAAPAIRAVDVAPAHAQDAPAPAPIENRAQASTSPLILSEYIEGTGNNKAVELFNPSADAVDLDGYTLELYPNGGTTPTKFPLHGTVAPGGVFTFGHAQAEFAAQLDQSTGSGLWNGDDALVLRQGDTVVDSIGRVGERPNGKWGTGTTSTLDAVLRRTGTTPDTVIDDPFDPASDGWQGFPLDAFEDLGKAPAPTGSTTSSTTASATTAPTTATSIPATTTTPTTATSIPATATTAASTSATTSSPSTSTTTGQPAPTCGAPGEKIGAVQGDGPASPMVGTTVSVSGTVVGDFQTGGFDGFFVQDAGDGNDATSDGVFVYAPKSADVKVGDTVAVTGKVSEFHDQTQINSTGFQVCASGRPLPAPAQLRLPANEADKEKLEGMRVALAQDAVINEAFNYDRFGELALGTTRHRQPTNDLTPGSPEAQALAAANAADTITLDDGVSAQNPDPLRHPDGAPFTIDHRFRIGDTLRGVTGVLDWRFDLWRIQPTEAATVVETNPRPQVPQVGGNLKVASANVLNYFTTLSSQDPNARGASTPQEFARQQDKIVAELAAMDADVVGLMEIENNGTAVKTLVDALNAKVGAGTYTALETGRVGTDAITTALIFKPAKVSPEGEHKVLDESVDPAFNTSKNRPALAQVFKDAASGKSFTVSVNHLKSKGSSCDDAGDPEDPNGQGNCNGTRVAAATALAKWLTTDPQLSATEGQLIIGDLNSYAKEDPIAALTRGGFADQIARFVGPKAYSYVFDGQVGYLDHALASAGLAKYVVGVGEWHNNADEPDILDYTMKFKKDAQDAIFAPDAYRASDHDPVLIGLDLTGATPPAPTDPKPTEPVGGGSLGGLLSGSGELFGTSGPASIEGISNRSIG